MKQLFLLFIAAVTGFSASAQRHAATTPHLIKAATTASGLSVGRTTALGDTLILRNTTASDTLSAYTWGSSLDSGYTTGMNIFGDMGYAERYEINGNDSSVKVLGVMAQFTGAVSASSARTVTFKVWDVTNWVTISASLAYDGFPRTALDTVSVPVTRLGIGAAVDTMKSFMFDTATRALSRAFFVGYDMQYNFTTLAGDTIAVASSQHGDRTSPLYNIHLNITEGGDTTRDTVIHVQNAVQWSDAVWHDKYTDNDSVFSNLALFPIVKIGAPTGIASITRKSLTFYGCYPNPATQNTNIKLSLSETETITIKLMDMTGRVLSVVTPGKLQAGTHIIPMPLTGLTPGNYIYSIHTSTGTTVASQLSVQ